MARAARSCDSSPKWSVSSRVTPYLLAIRSAPSNWLVNSKCSKYLRVIGLPMPACTPAIASEPIGNRLMFSTPQASTTSSAPDEIRLAPRLTANWLDPHCESIVEQATSGERPAVSHAVRVTLKACAPTLLMHPPITWPTAAGATFARLRTSAITCASISVGCALDSAPFFLPIGDRPASTITTSRMTLLHYTGPGARSLIFSIGEVARLSVQTFDRPAELLRGSPQNSTRAWWST